MFAFRFFALFAGLLVGSQALAATATVLTAEEIVRQANLAAYYTGNDGRAEARMKITDKQGRTQYRQFTILRRNQTPGGDQDVLVFFSRPSDVRNTVFRVIRHPGSNDDRWLYLPGLDLEKRISAGDQRTSFVGSDFFYEDVSGRDPAADKHRLLETTATSYLIESTPVTPKQVEFSRYQSWIDKTTLLPMKVEYTDSRGKIYRRMETLAVDVIQGRPTPVHGRISDLERGSTTEIQMRGIQYDLGLPENIFSARSMRNPPKQWLKGK